MKIDQNHVVSIHYTLTNANGVELDSSREGDPLTYLHGADNIIPGLERELAGCEVGDKLEVVVEPDDAYGPRIPQLVQTVPLAAFEGVDEVLPGMRFQAEDESGETRAVLVTDVTDEGVELDGNHPLAGEVLHFDVSVESVRAGTDEEIEHGHAH